MIENRTSRNREVFSINWQSGVHMEIDGATWTALGGLAAACGTAIKVVYTRVINKTDLQISTLEVKLDKCEEKHAECEKAHKELGKRMAFVEGHLSAQGVVIPQGENS